MPGRLPKEGRVYADVPLRPDTWLRVTLQVFGSRTVCHVREFWRPAEGMELTPTRRGSTFDASLARRIGEALVMAADDAEREGLLRP